MGMYTGIRFKGYVKEGFRDIFKPIALYGEWEYSTRYDLIDDVVKMVIDYIPKKIMVKNGNKYC